MKVVTCLAFVAASFLAELIPLGNCGCHFRRDNKQIEQRSPITAEFPDVNIPDKSGAVPHNSLTNKNVFTRQAVIGGFNTNTGYYSAYLPTLNTAPLLGSLNGFQEPIFPGAVDASELVVESIEEEIIPVQPDDVLIPSTSAEDVGEITPDQTDYVLVPASSVVKKPIVTPGLGDGTAVEPLTDDLETIDEETEESDFK